ncbi:hypothetical protein [Desulfolutivibrio sulfoxidireducens]|uniref:hypothetical protein n=1 Tax=Desulfolutivibrio sulfoxidireducens TaxID=2773299 RepID=UPI00159D6F00|nr:hypothetical protein [Desulfolutivibrio sulfoxidireducens]QLA16707.1 hypothetical protein GD605_11585 [Desulfolutivibrio sulfoxidireducens]QLA19416.1 hypothetical protein GD604_06500 [Desulfolutivibrio sulfoxidireducens]
MRGFGFVPAAVAAIFFFLTSQGLATPPDESIPRYLKSIELCKENIAADERILHEYEAEMRRIIENDPAAAKRRVEIRILKKHYNEEIDGLRDKIVDYYKKIQELRQTGKGGRP